MKFEDLFGNDINPLIEVCSKDGFPVMIYSGSFREMPEEVFYRIRKCKVTEMFRESNGTLTVWIKDPLGTFAEFLSKRPDLDRLDLRIYLGEMLAFANNLSKLPPELLKNFNTRRVERFDLSDDLKSATIVLDDLSDLFKGSEYPLLKDELPKLRKHHLGWTVIILNQDDDEYDRFTLSSELTEYETNPELCDILSEQIDTEDNWDDVAEIIICTNICTY